LFATAARRGDDAPGEPAQRQRLQPHLPGAPQRGEEKPFATEERALDVANVLDVVVDARLKRDEAARVDSQRLARLQFTLDDRAACVDEQKAVALQTLEDESLAAEEARAQAFREGNPDAHALRRAQESILLREQLAADLGEMYRND